MKNPKIINAVLIGFCIGIILYSVIKNTWGFFTLIPIIFIYALVNRSKEENQPEK